MIRVAVLLASAGHLPSFIHTSMIYKPTMHLAYMFCGFHTTICEPAEGPWRPLVVIHYRSIVRITFD
jgi:hypothetical protein